MIHYEGTIYRPPSEAYSLIIQLTVGCSHNKCNFCSMYTEKRFHLRPVEDVIEEFRFIRAKSAKIQRVFLADGDALIARTENLLRVLTYIEENFPECQRVSCYASPRSLQLKTPEELQLLRQHNLQLLYMGLESGSDTVLRLMNKGSTVQEIVDAGIKAKAAGMELSVTAISGLGGTQLMREHAEGTAKAFSEMKPNYIGLLTLMVEQNTPIAEWVKDKSFTLLSAKNVLEETYLMLENTDSEGSVFRMNHASNYLQLKGTLNGDTPKMLAQLRRGIDGQTHLTDESWRAL